MGESERAESVVLAATGRSSLHDALAWIAEDRHMVGQVRSDVLLAAVASFVTAPHGLEALRALARTVLVSSVDPSADLLGLDDVVPPSVYRAALEQVCRYTASGTLNGVTGEAVAYAQSRNPNVVATLGLVAGLSWRDLRDRTSANGVSLPSAAGGAWQHHQVIAAFEVIDRVIADRDVARLPGARPARPVELLFGPSTGWGLINELFEDGVGYDTLLTQRAVGGAWLSHRQSTTGRIPALIADQVCAALSDAGVEFLRAGHAGGDVTKSELRKVLGAEPGQVGVVAVNEHRSPVLAVAISVARDGGTARKNSGRLRSLPSQLETPAAAIVVGPGWAERSETTELIAAFDGRVFTERTMTDLAAVAAALSRGEQ